ncbi:hypothetical protein TSAR_001549 [Trichomalopsis sarcophagae]|uniref:Uncharacterized protein n=1 Tax=Trichomalopsis sarcophagae TaxID=543379 RepID=A0A232F828_9HYME|nr:hypothetical protein TSAR_001549 [Trichomalopsis sarcophagae]
MQDWYNRVERDRHRDLRKIFKLVFNFTSSHHSNSTTTPSPVMPTSTPTVSLLLQRRLTELLQRPANDTWCSRLSSRKRRFRQREPENEFATERLIKFEDEEKAIDDNEELTRPPWIGSAGSPTNHTTRA